MAGAARDMVVASARTTAAEIATTGGALFPTFDRALRALGKHARAPTTHDSTRYGNGMASRGPPPGAPGPSLLCLWSW